MKSRIYVEHFPAERPSSPYMAAYYDSLLKSLRADQVHAIDINCAFMNSPKRTAETPFYYRADSHWSPSGALHALRVPLPGAALRYTKLRIYPGRNFRFAQKNSQISRPPGNLLN
jgi:hypothetical protein